MNNSKISIIVPVYKAEKYLKRCVDSILAQTYTNFELILVDDGSPDTCPAMCDQFAMQDNRIKVIHKKNGGVSSARNEGIKVATSPFITFVDSDDYVTERYVEHLMQNEKADYIVSGYLEVKNDGQLTPHTLRKASILIDDIRNVPELINLVPLGMVWGRRYKKQLIADNNLFFDESMRRGEDVFFNAQYLYFSSLAMVFSVSDYFYVNTSSSATTHFEPMLFQWSMKSVSAIGEIIGVNNNTFGQRVWNNAVYVCEDYMKNIVKMSDTAKALFEVCCNRYVRRSAKCKGVLKDRKIAVRIRWYVYHLIPFLYPLKRKILK